MLQIILIVRTKRISIKYTYKEMRRELKSFSTKNQLNTKGYNWVNLGPKSYKM